VKNLPGWVIELGEFIIILCIFVTYVVNVIINGKDTTYR
jgi:hypothetical protein